MTLSTLLLLIVIATGLAWRRWVKSSRLIYLISVALFLGIGCGFVPAALLEDLQAGYPADSGAAGGLQRSAIVLLGSGTVRIVNTHSLEVPVQAYGRVVRALELYLECKRYSDGCTILVSGGDPQQHGASEASVYGTQLLKLGVNPADLVLEERSLNTWQNAQFSARLLSAHPGDRVFLVTSGVHLRRSCMYFERFGVHATPVRADYIRATRGPLPLPNNFLFMDLAVHEYAGILRYYVYERMGWNVTADHPGAL